MALLPYIVTESRAAKTPLIVDSPHSGRIYPADFAYTCPFPLLQQAEDSYVDELIMGAVDVGAAVLTAEFPRSYIDVNRAEDDIDPAVLAEPWPTPLQPSEKTLQGLGLVRRYCKTGIAMYAAPLPVAEVQQRLDRFYHPYHAALEKLMAGRKALFGECYLINAHSMPGQGHEYGLTKRPDFVLGDRNGTSCDPSFTAHVQDLLHDMGFSVALNDPYKGVEIVCRHGQPQKGQQALQIEINRRLYMNEQTLEKTAGFARLQKDMTHFFKTLAADIMKDMPGQMAAE